MPPYLLYKKGVANPVAKINIAKSIVLWFFVLSSFCQSVIYSLLKLIKMTTTTLKAEIKIMMQFFKLSDYSLLIKVHGGIKEAHSHLAQLFDDRKAIKN